MVTNVNGQTATRISAMKLSETSEATLWDCEGDEVWLPNSTFRDNKDGTIDVQDWIYKQKF